MERFQFSWNDDRCRSWIYQIVLCGVILYIAWSLWQNMQQNLAARHIQTGFDFLNKEAGFAIGESLIDNQLTDTYWRAILVGLVNTLFVSFLGIILATVLGTVVGIGRLSKNWLVRQLATVYVEVMRNIPLLIHLFFWYALLTEVLPGPRQALNPINGVFLSNRGIKIPALEGESVVWLFIGLIIALVLSVVWARFSRYRQMQTGNSLPVFWVSITLLLIIPFISVIASGSDLFFVLPELKGFNFIYGWTLTPELVALLVGLVLYTAGFVAEIVRSGIQSVDQGQWEAGESLGLSKMRTLWLVVLPQALRVMIPALSNTYMNLTKNSSLAVAIGYPDFVSIVNTMLTQTGQAIESVMIIMLAYFSISISIALLMAWYNKSIALVER